MTLSKAKELRIHFRKHESLLTLSILTLAFVLGKFLIKIMQLICSTYFFNYCQKLARCPIYFTSKHPKKWPCFLYFKKNSRNETNFNKTKVEFYYRFTNK